MPRVAPKLDLPWVSVERTIFESRPRYHLTANLYVPVDRRLLRRRLAQIGLETPTITPEVA